MKKKQKRKAVWTAVALLCLAALTGCGKSQQTKEDTPVITETPKETFVPETTKPPVETQGLETSKPPIETQESETIEADKEVEPEESPSEKADESVAENGYLVVIDAGHQLKGDSQKEPVGPGATETKAKVSSGTTGRYTKTPEYEVNLQVSLRLQTALEAKGYQVIMTRETNDVNLSNSERANIANEAKADVFIRIHANGSENTSANGIMTICQTANNPYNAEFYKESRRLSECILEACVEKTGAKKESVWETDTMTGINWAKVPSTILEMGYLTNETEDRLLGTEEYQEKMVAGIVAGIEAYLQE
jgi:N-acetylmuramoyl-L-alanine amidase